MPHLESMKIINIIFGTFVSLSVSYGAMTENDFVSVTNDWYRGVYSNVCALASYRESLNSNDVVAAYILRGGGSDLIATRSANFFTARYLSPLEKAGLIRISGKADRFSPHKLFELTARGRRLANGQPHH